MPPKIIIHNSVSLDGSSTGFVSEISLLIHPVIVGNKSYDIFGGINGNIKLRLCGEEVLGKQYIRLVYKV